MKINKVEIKNFYSIHSVDITFDDYDGLVVIKGNNRDTGGSNGSGKSAIFEAVVWSLFGKTIRKSNEDAMVNTQHGKQCSVTTVVNDNMVISRGRKPSYLSFVVDGEDLTQASVADTQRRINETLSTNYKVFMASMVFGQHSKIDFLGSTPDDKRAIIRNFLNLEDVFGMRDSIKKFKSEANQKIKASSAVLDECFRDRDKFSFQLSAIERDKSKFSFSSVDVSLPDILLLEGGVRKLRDEVAALDRERRNLRREESELRNLLKGRNSRCPTCGSVKSIDKKSIDEKLDLTAEQIGKISKRLVNLESEVGQIHIPISSDEYSEFMEYEKLCSKQETFESLLGELDERISCVDAEKLESIRLYEVMRFWEKAFSEQGMIRYVIKNILDFLNNKCNMYLSYLTHSQFTLKFDDQLNEVIKNNGKKVHYISLSGGEKKKVNLSVMLALQSLLSLTDKDQTNILFFDEIAESLDRDGMDGLYILLQELKKDKTVFLITHNKYLKILLDNAKRLTIIKDRGISRLLKEPK